MSAFEKYRLEVVVFTSGAVVMIIEIVGSRVLAPYLGTSVFVWTSLIGIILGSLSIGYWYGGKLADRHLSFKILGNILLIAGIFVFSLATLHNPILSLLQIGPHTVKWGSIVSGTILFAPPSILLGMVSPYSIRLKIKNVKTSGATIGKLYALSTVGSIVGTFLAGFVLISLFGVTKILIVLSIALVALSIFAFSNNLLKKTLLVGIFIGGYFARQSIENYYEGLGIIDVDTRYSRIQIFEGIESGTNRPVKVLKLNGLINSGIYLDNVGDHFSEYLNLYRLAEHFRPDFKKTLLLGGAGYVYPDYFLKTYTDAHMDVVEIDKGVTKLAREHFTVPNSQKLRIFHEDGRMFLNRTDNKYDVIFTDAFNSTFSPPFQLTTKEAVQKMHDALREDGIVITNTISRLQPRANTFLNAEYHTYKGIFAEVYLFPILPDDPTELQNVLLVALKQPASLPLSSQNTDIDNILKSGILDDFGPETTLLTDDFSPVEQYYFDML
jgi:spermidine synthase